MRSERDTRSRSISPPMMQPARKGWSSGIAPLTLAVVRTGAPQPLGEGRQLVRCAVPQHSQPHENDGPPCAAEHVERDPEAAGVRLHRDPLAQQGRAVGDVRRLGPGLIRGDVDVDRPGHRGRRGPQGPAYLGADRPGVKRRLPLRDRRVHLLEVQDLAEPGLVGVAGILVGEGDEGRSIQPGMGDAVDHVRGARAAGRGAHAGAAGDLPPGGGQHRAGDFLLHQDVAHVARPRRVHQLDGLAAGVADDEGGAALPEGVGQDFDGAAHRTGSRPRHLAGPRCQACGAGHRRTLASRRGENRGPAILTSAATRRDR